MAKSKEEKREALDQLRQEIKNNKAFIFINFQGLKTKDIFELRKKLKSNLSRLRMAKKTLIALSLKNLGIDLKKNKLEGQVAIAFGNDEINLSKILFEFSEKFKSFKIIAGYLKNGEYNFLEQEKIIELANLPTRKELLSKLIWTISNPISKLINIGTTNIKGLVLVLNKINK